MFTTLYSDRGIVRRVLRGNTNAFGILLDRYSHIVYGVAYAKTGNASDAEEITQETFVRLFQWLDRIAGRASIGPWLVGVARNTATDVLRRRHRERPLDSTAEQAVAARDFARDELRKMVWDQLADVDEAHREVLILHYFQGVKIREIARLLGISTVAAAKRLQRSRDELSRRLLDAIGEETAAKGRDSRRARKIMAAIATAPATWHPSPALSLAGAAIVGASAAKVVAYVAVATLIAVGLFAGWRYINRPYDTQNITGQSEFSSKPTEPRKSSAPAAQTAATAPQDTAVPAQDPQQAMLDAGTAAIYGVVLDKALKPVPGATVNVSNQQSMLIQERMKTIGYYPFSLEAVNIKTTTNDDGSFYFDKVPLSQEATAAILSVSAEKENLFGERSFRCRFGLREQYVEVIVEPAAALTVKVIDKAGTPFPEAKVAILLLGTPPSASQHETGADGSVTIPRLVPNQYRVSAGIVGYASVSEDLTLSPGPQTVVLTLGSDNSISGRLVFAGDGSPIPNVKIGTYCKGSKQTPSAKTDDAGQFYLRGLDANTYEFLLSEDAAPFVIDQSPKVRVTDGVPVTGVEVQAVEGAFVSGSVVDEKTRQPIPHVYMIFGAPLNNYTNGTYPRTYSDEKGQYSAGPFIPGAYEVHLHSSTGLTRKPFTLSSLKDVQGVDFTLEHHLSIGGTVTDSSGQAVAGASVVAAGAGGDETFAISDASGQFSLSIAAAERPVFIQAFSAVSVSPRVGPVSDGDGYNLQLQTAARIEGTVVDTAGKPQPGMLVVARHADKQMISIASPAGDSWNPVKGVDGTVAETSLSGSFQMAPVLPGSYELEVYAQSSPAGYPAATAKATVGAGETLETRLVLDTRAFGNVEGKVIINGRPLCGAWVSAKCEGERWLGSVRTYTDTDGAYRISNLRPGKMTISMFSRTGQATWDRTQELVLAAGETARVDFEAGDTNCGFDGFVTVGGSGIYARLIIRPTGSTDETAKSEYETDAAGYYRATDLQQGAYDIEVLDLFSARKVYTFAQGVEARENEVVRQDFAVGAGSVEGTVIGIRNGEVGHVALFPETADFSIISAALGGEILNSTRVLPGEVFKFEQLPVGAYYVGAVAVPEDKESDQTAVLANINKGRYAITPIEIVPGQTTTLELAIP